MKKSFAIVKNNVKRHKVAYAIIGTAAVCALINRQALKQHDEFLKEHDLYDAFYTPEAA